MTLQVPFDQFAKAAGRVLGSKEAYVTRHPSGTLVTACNAGHSNLLVSVSDLPLSLTREKLISEGIEVFDGVWSMDGDIELAGASLAESHIAAIAYNSADSKPGLWVDVFEQMPTELAVLRAMYDEFHETGELEDVNFEEFVRLASPNVLILTPSQLQGFLDQKKEC